MSIRLTKQIIRSKILLKLKIHKEEDRERKNQAIENKLYKNSVFKKAKTVMFYLSFGGEVKTQKMIKAAQKLGKIVSVPTCQKNRMIFPCILTQKAVFKIGSYGVCEPAAKNRLKIKDLDLVVVPGLAFDKKGNRLGRGRGCYDHFLKKLSDKVATIGLAYDFQVLPAIPTTKTDVSVDRVIFA
ncbi:MAG: 5-formyltetrahydrofolate cyclo-ligase [Candidatus Omnitrophica bacterium]|jgi:5-formyltetrahydrofolate cyclo-ligase|nr:5-formyltetrahydrofolate cyclo-ligase [Candidatus Omnitrophota bacterium]